MHINKESSTMSQKVQPIDVQTPRYGQIYNIFSSHKHFNVTIANYLGHSCIYFVIMSVASLGGCGAWVQCKHLYQILQNIMYYRQSKSSFIIPHGVGMRFNVCWHMLKHLKANDIIIKLDLRQFLECLFCYHYSWSNMCTQLELAVLVLVENFQGWNRKNNFTV